MRERERHRNKEFLKEREGERHRNIKVLQNNTPKYIVAIPSSYPILMKHSDMVATGIKTPQPKFQVTIANNFSKIPLSI